MKKITLLLTVVLLTTNGFATNLLQNYDFEVTPSTFTVEEGGFNVLMRVAAHQDAKTQIAAPVVSTAQDVVDGMWVKKSPNSNYIKGVVRTDLTHPKGKSEPNSVLNLRHNQNSATTGLTNWYQNVLQQRIAGGVDLSQQYYVSFDAKVDDETSPTLTNIASQVVVVIRDLTKNLQTTQTVQLTSGTTWSNYTATFNLPAWVTGGGNGAEGINVIFGIGLATDYDENAKTKYSSVLIDNIHLSIDPKSNVDLNASKNFIYSVQEGKLNLMNLQVDTNVQLYNLTGSLVNQIRATNSDLSIQLESGFYIVKIDNQIQKIVVK